MRTDFVFADPDNVSVLRPPEMLVTPELVRFPRRTMEPVFMESLRPSRSMEPETVRR